MISDAFIEAVAAIVLQTAIRRFLAIRRTQALRARRTSMAGGEVQNTSRTGRDAPSRHSEQQSFTHEVDPRDLVSQEDFFYDLAAIQIQSIFRGWWVRDSINVDH